MTEAEREAFVASFTSPKAPPSTATPTCAPSGWDQPGHAVQRACTVGVALEMSVATRTSVATLGLPQVNEVNEAMKRRLHELFGDGYAYAYLYPACRRWCRRPAG